MSDKKKNMELEIEALSDDDLESVAGGRLLVDAQNTSGSGTCNTSAGEVCNTTGGSCNTSASGACHTSGGVCD